MLAILGAVFLAALGTPASLPPEPTQAVPYQTLPAQHNDSTNPSVEKQKSEADQRTGEKENENKSKKNLISRVFQFIREYNAEIVTLSTAIMALFTVALFIATFLLWSGGERHSERELRAYLSATPFMVLNWGMEKEFIGVDCHFENHGQTPAFEINHVFQIAIAEGFNPELPPADIPVTQNNVVFPHSFLSTRFFLHRPLTKEEIRDVEEGKRRMHCWGVTTYRDAFRIRRRTRFARSVGGPDLAESARALRQGKSGVPIRW